MKISLLLTALMVMSLAGPLPAQEQRLPQFVLRSSEVADGGILPIDFTGDGSGSTLPLAWEGGPKGTACYAVIMHHIDPEGKTKWYWVLYNIPANIHRLQKNVTGIGTLGNNSINGRTEYAPPHSRGPGTKTYIYTVYALSAPPQLAVVPTQVTRDVLLVAIKDSILGSAELKVTYTRQGGRVGDSPGVGDPPPPPPRTGEDTGGTTSGLRKPWLQQHGTGLDANKDGVVTWAEITDDMNLAFTIYDRNSDGDIAAGELKATGDEREGAAFAGLIHRHFKDLDSNGNGNVSHDEMAAAVKYIFDAADLDRDGKLTSVEWQNAPGTPLPIPTTHGIPAE